MPTSNAVRPNSWITATLVDGTTLGGFVHAVDPETGNVLLLEPQEDGASEVEPVVVFSHALASFEQHGAALPAGASERATLLPVGPRGAQTVDATEQSRRYMALCDLLRKQRIPFTTEPCDKGGELLVILSCLRVAPPYTEESCSTENETVLRRFRDLLARLGSAVDARVT